jgi:hypothetical protein
MGCSGLTGGLTGVLMPTGGNQCALILTSHSPCRMEIAGELPDETACSLLRGAGEMIRILGPVARGVSNAEICEYWLLRKRAP